MYTILGAEIQISNNLCLHQSHLKVIEIFLSVDVIGHKRVFKININCGEHSFTCLFTYKEAPRRKNYLKNTYCILESGSIVKRIITLPTLNLLEAQSPRCLGFPDLPYGYSSACIFATEINREKR